MKKQKNKQGIKASKLAKAENKLKKQAEQMITVKNAEGEPDTQAKILIQNKVNYTPKVSVIIPVYNVEEYLRECLDSVVNQTLKEIEIICVDDGSTDNSLEILKEYAKKDNRISVLTQENLHAGVARNAGLAVAKGEYVHFLDSDDWIDKETYQEVLQDINSSDIGIFKGIRIDYKLMQKVDMTWLASPKLNGIYNTEALYKNLYTLFSPEIWNKLYKLNFLRKFNLYFQSIISCNDVYFSYAALGLSQTLSVKQSMFYHYRFNTGKQITSIRQNYPLNILYALNGVRKTLEKNGKIAQLEESLQNAAVNDIVYSIKKCNSMQYISQYAKFFTGKRADEYICTIKKTMTIPIVFATNDQYARYVPVTIYSILCNSDTAYTYEFYIFHTGLLSSSKKLIENIPIMGKHNYQITFINLKKQLNNTTLYSKGRFSAEMWYRLFIPETLKEYKKAIYLDCDLIVQGDIAQLYNKDIGQNYLGACRNFVTTSKERLKKLNILIDKYFNSGVLVFNIEEWNKKHIKQACLDAIPLYPNLDCPDQDILNIVCKGKIKYFDYKWNFSWQFLWDNNLSNEEAEIYQQAQEEICIIHYTSGLKPWKNSDLRFADIWWKYANSIGIKKTSHDYKRELQIWYQRVMGEYLNLDNPRTFNEKIQWLKLYNSTPIKTRLADKYLVRDWVKEKIGEQYLIPLLGVYDKFEDIDFDKLPNQFVIKCNHGSGWNIIVKDKSKLNLSEVKEKLDKWMSTNFAFKVGCELHYKNMQPKIIIEKYMEDDSGDLRDYKFLCFDGIVKYIWVDGERYSEHKRNLYDLKWNLLKKKIGEGRIYQNIKNCPKPYNLDKMIEFATLLSKDFSFVRVDFFEANKKLYFGEMTFTSASGTHITEPKSFIFELGDLIKLPKLAYNIETGEYYKLPKRSKIKPYILLPYNLCQKVYWRCEERKINCKYIRKQLSNTRIDIKNFGNKNNAVEITASAKVSQPDWFSNAQGIGQVVSANNKIQNITIKAIQDGKLRLDFKGTYKNIEGKNYPVWADYKSIKIDGKEVLSVPIATWHDKPFRYEMPVKDGQIVKVDIVQQYHLYSKDELKDVILKLNPNSDYIKENIEKLTHKIYKKITLKKPTIKVSGNTPQTTLFARVKQNVQEKIKLWQDKLSFAHKIAPIIDLMQQNQTQTLKLLQEIQAKNTSLENKNNELKKEIEVLKGTLNTQLSDFKKQQEERSKQLMAIGDRLSAEFQHVANDLQRAEQSQVNEVKATLSDFIAQLAVAENKLSAEFQRVTKELQRAEQSQASEIKATLKDCITQFAATENKLIAELQYATEKLQNSGISEISEIKTYCTDLAHQLDSTKVKLINELNNQRETALQNKNNIIAGINQTEQSLQIQVAKSQELAKEQQNILDRVQERLEDLSVLKEIDFAKKEELKTLSQDIEQQKTQLLEKVQNSIDEFKEYNSKANLYYKNPFEVKTRTDRGLCDMTSLPDFEDRFRSLIKGLKTEDVATIVNIIKRLQLIKNTNQPIDLFSPGEKAQLRELKQYYQMILKVSDNLYCYKNYFLPINHFEASVFYYQHGLSNVNNKKYFADKDILDIGAFIGDSALILSPLTTKKVYCFEAMTENYNLLQQTIKLNNLKNIETIKSAVGSEKGEIEILYNGSGSSSDDMMVANPKYKEKCSVVTIDEYVKEHNLNVGLIKVDIEGAEQSFLQGAIRTIKEQKPTLLISIYHNTSDFLDIKPIIEGWNVGYKFKIFKPVLETVSGETLLICEQ